MTGKSSFFAAFHMPVHTAQMTQTKYTRSDYGHDSIMNKGGPQPQQCSMLAITCIMNLYSSCAFYAKTSPRPEKVVS